MSLENLLPLTVGIILSTLMFILGHYWHKHKSYEKLNREVGFKTAVIIVVFSWLIASGTSALVYILAGIPDPDNVENYSLLSRVVDSYFESMSGLTTTGSSILVNFDSIHSSIHMWRVVSHWIGGMGLVYMTITLINNFKYSRFNLINAEVESPEATEFKDENDARNSGFDFAKIYGFLTVLMFLLLVLSGALFRNEKYENISQNVYDSAIHTFSVLGTGGFSNYGASAGLPILNEEGEQIKGGLQNEVSEWIIIVFMFMSGGNFGLWYIFFFKRDFKSILRSGELKTYLFICIALSVMISGFLFKDNVYGSVEETLRNASFTIATIISTTGLANTDFSLWPNAAMGILLVSYFVGGTVGSTAGGLKVKRYIAFFKLSRQEIVNFVEGETSFRPVKVDQSNMNRRDLSLLVINIGFYMLLYIIGGIILIITNDIDFSAGMNASIASLGNIGPTIFVTDINDGPAGGYAGFSEISKVTMIVLMLFGRIGVLKLMFLLSPIFHKASSVK